MKRPLPIEHFENRNNLKYPNDPIKVLYRLDGYLYFNTKFGICKRRITSFSKGTYNIQSAINKTEFAINKLISIYANKYDYSLVKVDKTGAEKIILICKKHGNFETTLNKAISCRVNCPKCSKLNVKRINLSKQLSLKECENRHNRKFPNNKIKTVWKKGEYIYFITEFGLCKKQRGTFGKTSYNIRSAVDKNSFIINQFKQIHGNKYIYDEVVFVRENLKVKIICPKHGSFEQSPNKHLNKRGCEKCAREITNKHQRENATGWSLKSWRKQATKSKKFDSFKLYILRCWRDEEEFYKIGRTFKTIKSRFDCIKNMPYNYEVVKIFIDNAENIYNLEIELKKINKEYKYTPKIKFGGMQECYYNYNFKTKENEKNVY